MASNDPSIRSTQNDDVTIDVDVAIVGAGPVGLTLALGLARREVPPPTRL